MAKIQQIMLSPFAFLEQRVAELEVSVFGKNSKTNKLEVLSVQMEEYDKQAKLHHITTTSII